MYTLHLAPIPYDFIHRKLTYVGDRAIAVSSEIKDFMNETLHVPEGKIEVVLNGVYPPEVSGGYNKQCILEKYHIPEGKMVLLMNSRIAEIKNHLLMVEAIHNLSDEVKEKVVVVCTGDKSGSYYNKVQNKIAEYGLDRQFVFTGWAEPYELLAISDFLFLPSFAEGFPLNCVESFFMRVPVARTITGGYKDMEGLCIPISAEDYHSIIDIITQLLFRKGNPYEDMINKAYQFAQERLTIDLMTENTMKVYNTAIKDCYKK